MQLMDVMIYPIVISIGLLAFMAYLWLENRKTNIEIEILQRRYASQIAVETAWLQLNLDLERVRAELTSFSDISVAPLEKEEHICWKRHGF